MLRIIIFYIVLHSATNALKYSHEKDQNDLEFANYGRHFKRIRSDQILGNLRVHSFKRTSANTDNAKSDVSSSLASNDFNYKPNKNDKQLTYDFFADSDNIDNALSEVPFNLIKDMIDHNKHEIIKYNEVPVTKSEKRYKRHVANDTIANITSTEKNVTINVTSTEKSKTLAETVEVLRVNTNETEKEENSVPNHVVILNKTDVPLNGRRMLMAPRPEFVTTTNSRVKDKLLSYLEDTFREVEKKVQPLTKIKIALSNDDHYRIGYIIATIDTLEVNLKKLKKEMNLNQRTWDDEKILELLDRIKSSNTVTTSLIETLKKYLPQN